MLKTIIIVLIMFEVLIVGHEFGHYITAKKVGIKINEFAIGMGPAVLKKQKGETLYALRLLPIGGYVSMEGEDTESDDERSFFRKTIPQKMLVVAAGAIMNYLMAVVILIVMALMIGSPTTQVEDIVKGSAAEQIGIATGDRVVSIDNKKINEWTDLTDYISNKKDGDVVNVVVERNGNYISMNPVELKKDDDGYVKLGIYSQYQHSLLKSLKNGVVGSFDLIKLMYKSLEMIVSGEASPKDVVGPVGIVNVMGDAAAQGVIYVFYMTALISVNLAVVNLLPLPALDGGRLLFLILCAITRKPLSQDIEGKIHFVGFVLLMLLMVLITVKDVNQFILK